MERNEKEKNMLYEWGMKNNLRYHFSTIDNKKKSYFIERSESFEEDSYIKKYGFETLPELIKELDVLWENDEAMKEIKRVVGVSAIKNKPSKEVSKGNDVKKGKGTDDKLPTFIYNF